MCSPSKQTQRRSIEPPLASLKKARSQSSCYVTLDRYKLGALPICQLGHTPAHWQLIIGNCTPYHFPGLSAVLFGVPRFSFVGIHSIVSMIQCIYYPHLMGPDNGKARKLVDFEACIDRGVCNASGTHCYGYNKVGSET